MPGAIVGEVRVIAVKPRLGSLFGDGEVHYLINRSWCDSRGSTAVSRSGSSSVATRALPNAPPVIVEGVMLEETGII